MSASLFSISILSNITHVKMVLVIGLKFTRLVLKHSPHGSERLVSPCYRVHFTRPMMPHGYDDYDGCCCNSMLKPQVLR